MLPCHRTWSTYLMFSSIHISLLSFVCSFCSWHHVVWWDSSRSVCLFFFHAQATLRIRAVFPKNSHFILSFFFLVSGTSATSKLVVLLCGMAYGELIIAHCCSQFCFQLWWVWLIFSMVVCSFNARLNQRLGFMLSLFVAAVSDWSMFCHVVFHVCDDRQGLFIPERSPRVADQTGVLMAKWLRWHNGFEKNMVMLTDEAKWLWWNQCGARRSTCEGGQHHVWPWQMRLSRVPISIYNYRVSTWSSAEIVGRRFQAGWLCCSCISLLCFQLQSFISVQVFSGPDKCGYIKRTHMIFNCKGDFPPRMLDIDFKQGDYDAHEYLSCALFRSSILGCLLL